MHAYENTSCASNDDQWLSSSRLVANQERCLLIKHSDGWQNDRCESWLRKHGGKVETVICHDGTNLPDPSHYSRVILYGGQACISDADYKSSLQLEMHFIESVIKNNIPCFGICLGAQLIAHVLGASVKRLPCGTTEFGYSRITPTDEGKSFMPQPCNMLQWHCEGFDLPGGCVKLASNDVFPNQAFRYNQHTYGVQFHPEVTGDVLAVWHRRKSSATHVGSHELDLKRQLRDCKRYAHENERWLNHFMDNWISS